MYSLAIKPRKQTRDGKASNVAAQAAPRIRVNTSKGKGPTSVPKKSVPKKKPKKKPK